MDTFLTWLATYKDELAGFKELALIPLGIISVILISMRVSAATKASAAAEKQSALAATGQVNDQYIKAIEQLGSTNKIINLGGIYGLEKVAAISDEFYTQVIEVLTAYVRENTPKPDENTVYVPIEGVQAVLVVLGRARRIENINTSFNFRNCFLSEYNFSGNFSNASFIGADCTQSSFDRANCAGANFWKANCSFATFSNANCTKINCTDADCTEANFTMANCTEAIFYGANCTKAAFTEAICSKAIFLKAKNFSEKGIYDPHLITRFEIEQKDAIP